MRRIHLFADFVFSMIEPPNHARGCVKTPPQCERAAPPVATSHRAYEAPNVSTPESQVVY